MRVSILALAGALGAAGAAYAEPGGVSGVSSAVVSPGGLKIEGRSALFNGDAMDGDWAHRAQIGYSFNDWWRSTVIARAALPDDGDFDLRTVGFEQVFEFTPSADWPVQLGFLAEYKVGVDEVRDAAEFKLLMERRAGPMTARLNLIAERQVGDDASDEWEHAYATRVMWRTSEQLQLGFEGFGELDVNAHAWGPRVAWDLGQVTLAGAYLAALGDDAESDGQIRLAVEIEPKAR